MTESESKPIAPGKIVERIRKLLALGTSKNVNEASAAAAAAAKLMQEHRLEEADITDSVGDPDKIAEVPLGYEGFSGSITWKLLLLGVVSRSLFCDIVGKIVGKKRHTLIVGRREDAEIVRMVFESLSREIDRIADEEMKDPFVLQNALLDHINGFEENNRKYKLSFRLGAVEAIKVRMLDQNRRFAKSSDKAMVLVRKNAEAIKAFVESRYKGAEKMPVAAREDLDDIARYRGYSKGKEINIPDGHGGDEGQKRLESTEGKKKESQEAKRPEASERKGWTMDSEALNAALHEICDLEALSPPTLQDTGKSLPYIGWRWRHVDFDSQIPLARSMIFQHNDVTESFIGFVPPDTDDFRPTLKILNPTLSNVIRIGAQNLVAIGRDKLTVSDFATFHQIVITAYGAMG